VIVLAVALLGWFLYPTAALHYREQRKLEKLQTQLTQIQKRNKELKAEVEKLKTPAGVEEAAHELGYARKGEQVWIPVEGGKTKSEPASSPVRTADVAPDVWTHVLDVVFGVGP
jgi:hypothetical protein